MNLIIKIPVSQEAIDGFSNYDIYDREIEFYSEIAPKINKKLKEMGEAQLLPECFGICRPKKIMILEDLMAKGYKLQPALPGSRPGYNVLQAKAVLKRMAAFHAIGAVLQEEEPDIFVHFKSGQ